MAKWEQEKFEIAADWMANIWAPLAAATTLDYLTSKLRDPIPSLHRLINPNARNSVLLTCGLGASELALAPNELVVWSEAMSQVAKLKPTQVALGKTTKFYENYRQPSDNSIIGIHSLFYALHTFDWSSLK